MRTTYQGLSERERGGGGEKDGAEGQKEWFNLGLK